jgi:ubiquinone/menaquinone biosynthesis C-methylase UbiE
MSVVAVGLRKAEQDIQAEPANFDRLARIYRWLEWCTFGPLLWRCRCEFLNSVGGRHNALVVGDGDGRFSARLLKLNSDISVEAIDASNGMLCQLLRRTAANRARVRATVADARQLPQFEQCFDLVVTHFFLDCLTTSEVESFAGKIRRKLQPGACWIVSEFAVPDTRYGRLFARPLVSGLYAAFGLLTGLKVRRLPRYHEALERAGLALTHQRKWLNGLLVSELWEIGPAARS